MLYSILKWANLLNALVYSVFSFAFSIGHYKKYGYFLKTSPNLGYKVPLKGPVYMEADGTKRETAYSKRLANEVT